MNEELAMCAKINFENLIKDLPALGQHPYWIIAKAQLDEALGGPSVESVLEPFKTELTFENGKPISKGADIIESVNGVPVEHRLADQKDN